MAKTFNIVGSRKIFYAISIIIIAITVIFTFAFGVDVGIEFKGGTFISYTFTGEMNLDEIESVVKESINQEVNITQGESLADSSKNIKLEFASTDGLTADKQFELTNALQEKFASNELTLLSSEDVNPSTGKEIFQKCIVAVLFAFIILTLYIAFRFRRINGWSAGIMAIIALIHDVIVVYATFVIFKIDIDANFVAVVLTILGFSINDTIVIYDRIRENKKLFRNKIKVDELVNLSINQSLTRSINTSVCTITAMIVVSVVAVLSGVTSIISFAFPLIIGMISGVYSTICIAGPLWVDWQNHKAKKLLAKKVQKK